MAATDRPRHGAGYSPNRHFSPGILWLYKEDKSDFIPNHPKTTLKLIFRMILCATCANPKVTF